MEPLVPASDPVFRRAASFNVRRERALKDINGQVNLNKSQELVSTTKDTVDSQKGAHPTRQYSAVASRYAAPVVLKKQILPIADGLPKGHTNMTKLPFVTGKSASHHERKPSLENLKPFQPSIVFAATTQESVPEKKVNLNGGKRSRFTKKGSVLQKKSEGQSRPPWSLAFEGNRRPFSVVQGIGTLTGSASLLKSAALWVSLIKLAEVEREEKVVVDFFRMAIGLRATPIEELMSHLKRYQKLHPNDQIVIELVHQCEGIEQDQASLDCVSKLKDPNVASSKSDSEVSVVPLVSKTSIVPAGVSQKIPTNKKKVPEKPRAAIGRRISRSSTFSCVDTKSQASKVACGKAARTVEDLPVQRESQSRIDNSPPSVSGSNSNSQMSLVNGEAEKLKDSLLEWLVGNSSKEGTLDVHSATTDTVDLSSNSLAATLMQMGVDHPMEMVVSSIMPESNGNTPADSNVSAKGPSNAFHVRRKSWQIEQRITEEYKEIITKSHRRGLSGEAILLSAQGSVEEKVKLFTVLAEAGNGSPQRSDPRAAGVDLKAHHKTEVMDALPKNSHGDQSMEEEDFETPAKSHCKITFNERNKKHAVSIPKVLSREGSKKGETMHLLTGKDTSPSVATPREFTSTGSCSRKQQGSGIGRLTDSHLSNETGACPIESQDDYASPITQPSSIIKSKRMSQGLREVTPRCHLPKPSWRAIVEREMKGSKLKELLAGKMPEETSPLAEFLKAEMENQKNSPKVLPVS